MWLSVSCQGQKGGSQTVSHEVLRLKRGFWQATKMMQIFGYRTPPKKPEPEAPPVLNQSTTPPPPQPPQYTTPSSTTSTRSNSTTAGSARPLRLVYCDERGRFKMDPEAVAALQMVKGPLGVVSVCGRARQGKSFILNQVSFLVRKSVSGEEEASSSNV